MRVGSNPTWLVSLYKEEIGAQTRTEERLCRDSEKMTIYKYEREASEETNSANSLILGF